jgi:signal transduction histidine kinase
VKSIRARLVLWLVSALLLGSIAVLGGTYVLTRGQIAKVFDDELKQVAHAVHLREDWIRAGRLRLARPGFALSVRAHDEHGRVYFETVLPSLPADLQQTFAEGFTRADSAEGAWRLYTHVTPEGIVQVGQPVSARDALARSLALEVLTPMLLLIPLLALVIGWAFRRALAPLDEASNRVRDRDASRLDPLPTAGVPEELLPMIAQINALLARLGSSLDAQRRFLADAAHELRSPVGALALQVQLARRAPLPESRAAAMDELERGVERARRLVQQLLDYAQLEPGVHRAPMRPVDLARLARAVVGDFAARADEARIDLGAEAPASAWVTGSEPELLSLTENLIDNALRYTPALGAVTVAVGRQGGEVQLSVEDGGPGIPAAEREAVFGRFHRVPGDPTSGTGLGLAIVKSIVERHRGSIELGPAREGEERPGLLVRIRFPLSPGLHGAAEAAHEAAAPAAPRLARSEG